MRELTDAARLRQFLRLLGQRARARGRVYLVGGACAVWLDWRPTTLDIDLDLDPGLSKIERAHARDVADVREMAARGLIEPARLLSFFDQIAPSLYRYPAIDPASFRRAVEHTVQTLEG